MAEDHLCAFLLAYYEASKWMRKDGYLETFNSTNLDFFSWAGGKAEDDELAHMKNSFLVPINELCYLLECAVIDHAGELKTELSALCDQIESGHPPFDSSLVAATLPDLRSALSLYQSGNKNTRAVSHYPR